MRKPYEDDNFIKTVPYAACKDYIILHNPPVSNYPVLAVCTCRIEDWNTVNLPAWILPDGSVSPLTISRPGFGMNVRLSTFLTFRKYKDHGLK